jgi:hypothetical protein
MRHLVHLTAAAACCALVFTTACSDSTGPNNSQDPSHVAAHFDSLYVEASSLGTDAGNGRAQLLSLLELAPAFGAKPADVTVTTGSATEHWKGFELEEVQMDGDTPSDTTYLLLAYRESDAHTVLVAYYNAAGAIEDGGVFVNDTLSVEANDGTGTSSRTSLGAACGTASASLTNPEFAEFESLPCNTATFSTSMTLVVPETDGLDPALETLSLPVTTFNGLRIQDAAEAGQGMARRVRALLHSSRSASKRF